MYSKTPLNKMKKRPHEKSSIERPRKAPYQFMKIEDDAFEEMLFQFRILLPNATTIELKMSELRNEIPIEKFIDVVRKEYHIVVKQRKSQEPKRSINWDYPDLYFIDAHTNKIRIKLNLCDFMPNKWHFLWLHDGSAEPDAYEGMWDLTPDTDLLKELPDDYTFETALADLIDNSLEALWSNGKGERRLISVKLLRNRISIFDSDSGMDGADGNLVKWGKMGASLHRSMRGKTVGGEPPYLMVEIFEPKVKTLDIKHFRCKLKDIYFPYIQCDEMSGKTSTPIEFQVNGIDLAEIQGGEVATTNLHSCHGPDFILQLKFSISLDSSSMADQRVFSEANARLKCVYFPIVEGQESIKRILDALEADGCGIRESFERFSRVCVRRLGRLLPDARWALLPFMETKQKKGEKGHSLKRNSSRVKCFIDTDSGFNPTPYKTDLAHHHPYTKALKNLGNRAPENEKVQVEIFRDGKKLTLTELEKQYNGWILEMHDRNDEEIDGGLDQPTIVVVSSKISSDVLRVHKKIQRKGKLWTAGQNIKVLKGACAGCHKTNVFATLQYIILEGLPGDACGEAWLICRPLGLPDDRGCHLLVENDNNTIDFRDSLALPIRVIDSEKCIPVDDIEWGKKLEAYNLKLPSSIDLLNDIDCQDLEIEGALPTLVQTGDAPPKNIVVVIRPKSFDVNNSSNSLDQKFINRDNLDMSLEVKYRAGEKSGEFALIYSTRLSPSSRKGLHGLYFLQLRMKQPLLFQKAGFLTFSFSLKEPRDMRLERVVQVQASAKVGRWKVINQNKDELYTVRVGSFFKTLFVACYDRYHNRVLFTSVPKLNIELSSNGKILAQVCIIPGTPEKIIAHPPKPKGQLIPGQIIEELALEVFDEFGNHVKEDEIITLRVDGFSFQDGSGIVCGVDIHCLKKVDADGFVDLSNTLKVSKGYGKDVLLSVISEEKIIFKIQYQTETREQRSVQKVFKNCEAGTVLENIVFEITDSQGKVDESIHDEEKHGQSHTLTIKSDSFEMDDSVKYSFRRGRCAIHSIPLPQREGIFSFSAAHSRYPELNSVIEVHVENAREENHESIRNDDDLENLVFSDQRLCEIEQTLLHTPPLKVSQATRETFSPQSSKEHVSPISSSLALYTPRKEHTDPPFEKSTSQASASHDVGNFFSGSASICLAELEDDLLKSGITMNDHAINLQRLIDYQLQIQQDVSHLQASIDCDVGCMSITCNKESALKQIQSKSESAASVFCKIPFELRPRDVVGIVALLGTVDTIELSRMLAQYIGEDQMLAIVCRNYAAAYDLETNILHKFATEFGQTIEGGYHAFCLEDIRPKFRQLSSDPQKSLSLETPTLPDGNVPQGFLGYAVNLISIEGSHLQWRTKSGHGLRQTLFYRLFGEVQVYKHRKSMMAAQSCIKDGALSLDGGIVRGDGLVSLGHWEPPKIFFPVKNKPLSPKSLRTLQTLEETKSELAMINKRVDEEHDSFVRAKEKFIMTRDRYNSYLSPVTEVKWGSRNLKNLYG